MNDYTLLRRLAFAVKELPYYTQNDANTIIQDACEDAYKELDDCDRVHVRAAVSKLKQTFNGLGDRGALELLAALAFHMDGDGCPTSGTG